MITCATVPSGFRHGHMSCFTQVFLSLRSSPTPHTGFVAGVMHIGTQGLSPLHIPVVMAKPSHNLSHLNAHGSHLCPGGHTAIKYR